MPEEVRAEISPWFIDKQAIKKDCPEKIVKLDSKARNMDSNLEVNKRQLNFITLIYTFQSKIISWIVKQDIWTPI